MWQSNASGRSKRDGALAKTTELGVMQASARGQVLVLTAIVITVLIGFAALATDIGLLWSERRQMQTATDAAAIAGSSALRNGTNLTSAADNVASLNGFTSGVGSATIAVNNPPSEGIYAGNSSYVEVIIAKPEPTYFLRVLGHTTMNVSTRAVSGGINGPACIYALDPSVSESIDLTGNININAQCGVIDDSSSTTALYATGNGNINTTSIGVAGNYSASGNLKFTPAPLTNIAPAPDPLASLQGPAVSSPSPLSVTSAGGYSVAGNNEIVSISPAIYGSGISITGNNAAVNFLGGNYGNNITISGNVASATFNPGQYQRTGSGDSIDISGNAKTTFNSGGSYTFLGKVKIIGNNTVALQPGIYFGGLSITGNAVVTFSSGTYIFAGGGLSVTGNSTLNGSGVTFYDTNASGFVYGPIDMTGNETAVLSAPTSGPLAGILFFQDRNIPVGSAASFVVGNAATTFDGALYFPTTALTYTGNSSGSGYTFLIADTIAITGNTSMTLGNNYSSLSNGSPIQSSALYE